MARYPLGQPLRLSTTTSQLNLDGSYTLINSTTLTLVVAKPDATQQTYSSPTNDGAGPVAQRPGTRQIRPPGHRRTGPPQAPRQGAAPRLPVLDRERAAAAVYHRRPHGRHSAAGVPGCGDGGQRGAERWHSAAGRHHSNRRMTEEARWRGTRWGSRCACPRPPAS